MRHLHCNTHCEFKTQVLTISFHKCVVALIRQDLGFVQERKLVLILPLFYFLVCLEAIKSQTAILFYKEEVPLNLEFVHSEMDIISK